jgi:protein involved in sex pheromone biosynthesis
MPRQTTKTIGIILSLFLLSACSSQIDDTNTESNRIEGERIRGYVPAYNEMCLREPESKLCNKESSK